MWNSELTHLYHLICAFIRHLFYRIFTSSESEDEVIVQPSTGSKRTSREPERKQRKRQRSRSKSLTPPPEVPKEKLDDVRLRVQYVSLDQTILPILTDINTIAQAYARTRPYPPPHPHYYTNELRPR